MNDLKLPAMCSALDQQELQAVQGGSSLETAAKAVLAIGVSAGLVVVAGVAAVGILQVFNPQLWKSCIEGSMAWGKGWIDHSVEEGQKALDNMTPEL